MPSFVLEITTSTTMFTPPSARRGRASKTTTIPLSGFFDDGTWLCNCRPRLPAASFEVKKQGPNTGKWFYTCQKPNDQGCKFFLWAEKATEREKKAVLNNSRTEPLPSSNLGNGNGSPVTPKKYFTPASGKTFEEHMQESTGKMASKAKEPEEDFDWSLSPEEERSVEDAVTRASVEASTPSSSFPETPKKAMKTSIFDTPGSTKRKREFEALAPYPTPNTTSSKTDDVFTSTPTSKGSIRYGTSETKSILRSPSETPTPTKFRDASTANRDLDPSSSQGTRDYDLAGEITEILKDPNLGEKTQARLKEVLNRSRGIVAGREAARKALKSKELMIAESQERISGLETEREMNRLVIKKLREEQNLR